MARITAISSLGWAHYTLYQALPKMAARGFKRIELASFGSYCFHFNFGSPTPCELRDMLARFDLQPICLNYFTDFHHAWVPEEIDQFIDEWMKKLVQLSEVGIPMMVMSFGIRNDRDDHQDQLANAVKAYDRLGQLAEKRGIRMLLEVPHLYGLMPCAEDVLWVFDHLTSPNIGALVDCSHWGIIGYDIDAFFEALGARLWHIHLRDSAGLDTADRKQNLELTPGSGTVDFRKFAQALDNVNYKGDVTVEFEYRDLTLDAIDKEFDKGLTYLSGVGWELPVGVKKASARRS